MDYTSEIKSRSTQISNGMKSYVCDSENGSYHVILSHLDAKDGRHVVYFKDYF